MRKTAKTIAFCAVVCFAVATSASEKVPLGVDDGLRMKTVKEVTMSPDGNSVLFTVSHLDWTKNEYVLEHFLYRVSAQSTHRYIGDSGGEKFRFSPDGRHLAFLRELDPENDGPALGDSGETSQVFVMPTSGGEALQLTDHRGGVSSFRWAPSSDRIFFLAPDMADETVEAERQLGDDSYFVDEAPNGKRAARYTNFWSIDLGQRTESRLSELSLVVGDFDVSPDGERVVFDARPDTRTNFPHETELYLLSVADGTVERLTDNAAPEGGAMWSPDGKFIAYRAPDGETFELSNGFFWVVDLDSGVTRKLSGQSTGELSSEPAWSADSRAILYNEIHGTNTNLHRIDIRTGESSPLTNSTGTLRVHAYSAATDRMVYSYQNFTTPPDLFVSELGATRPRKITNLNPWISESRKLADGRLLHWRGKDDLQIEGVFFPALADDTEKNPLIVHIHGGPAGVVENAFRHDFQILAGLGFAILAPNVRGSTGYGDVFLRGLAGEVGDGEFVDMMAGVDLVIDRHDVDPKRLGVRGWSWGGVATSYAITQTDRFKAASIGAMVGNWAAEVGPGYNFDVSLWYIGGKPWDNPSEWQKRSSITHVKNVSTPAIIFHGGNDETSSVGQSLMFYTALREIGKAPVKYMRFPREEHGIEEPRHRRRLGIEEISWFMKHVRSEDWRPPAAVFGD